MEQALGLLSDGAFKLYVYLCLHAQRSSGRLRFRHSELAQSLGKSPRSITSYLKELQCQGACHVEAAANQHHVGSIEIADHFWPYRKPPFETPLSDETRYIEQVRQLFLSRACVQETFQRGRREACCGAVSASRSATRWTASNSAGGGNRAAVRIGQANFAPPNRRSATQNKGETR